MLDWALRYARLGWPVFPLAPAAKVPLAGKHGVKEATTDVEVIREWWKDKPNANIGLACGDPSGFVVLDVDPRNNGDVELEALCAVHGPLEPSVISNTGGGGQHLLFALPAGRLRKNLCPGVDVQGSGKHIVAPPSIHPDGGQYAWADEEAINAPLVPPPEWVLDMIVKPDVALPAAPERVAGDAALDVSWASILEPHGWVVVTTNGEATHWRRPGKTEGISATTNYEGCGLLYVFTSSTVFEPDRGYGKGAALAVLEHDGDWQAGAHALRMRSHRGPVGPLVYDFQPAFPPDHFVSRYSAWAGSRTDAPMEYHEAMALALLSYASPGARAHLSPYPRGLPLNLYLILCGGSTRTRKSTAQNLATSLLEIPGRPLPGWRLPNRTTPEAMIEDMAERNDMAVLWTPDEFGVTLAQIHRREFLRALEELLLSFYDCKPYTLRTLTRETTVSRPYLTVAGAATPESMAMAGGALMLGGLLPRFGIVFPRVLPDHRPAAETADTASEHRSLSDDLRLVFSRMVGRIQFGGAALALLNEAEEALVNKPHALRLPIMLYKVAGLSAVGRSCDTVELVDTETAIRVVDRWADGAAHLASFLLKKTGDFEFERIVDDAIDYIERAGGACLRTELANTLKVRERTIKEVGETLHGRGRLSVEKVEGEEVWRLQR